MKRVLVFSIVIILTSLKTYSIEPKLIWSNESHSISDIYYSGLSVTGDTLLIFEKDFLNLFNNKDYKLIRRINLNSFSGDGMSSLNYDVVQINLPSILISNVLVNIEELTSIRISDWNMISASMGFDNNHSVITVGKGFDLGKGEVDYRTKICLLDFQSKQVTTLLEFSSRDKNQKNIAHSAYRLNNSELLYFSDLGVKIFKINDSTSISISDESFFSHNSYVQYTNKDNILYLCSKINTNIVAYDLFTNKITDYKSNLNIAMGKDRVDEFNSYISPINPEKLFFNYHKLFVNEDNTYYYKYIELIYDIPTQTTFYENMTDSPVFPINISNNNFYCIRQKIDINNSGEFKTNILKTDLSGTGIENLKEFIYLNNRNTNLIDGKVLVNNKNFIEEMDINSGQILSKKVFEDDITRIQQAGQNGEYFVQYKNGEVIHSVVSDYKDYSLLYNFPAIGMIYSPNHMLLAYYSKSTIAIMDPMTLRISDTISNSSTALEFIDDSTLIFKRTTYKGSNPAIYNTKTKQLKIFPDTINKYTRFYFEKNNKKLYAISSDSSVYEISVGEKFSAIKIFKHDTQIQKFSVSYDNKFMALISRKPTLMKENQNEFLVYNLENNTYVHRSSLTYNSYFIDLSFTRNEHKVILAISDENGGYFTLKIYNQTSNKFDTTKVGQMFITKEMQKDGYWLNVKMLEFDQDSNIVFLNASSELKIYHRNDLTLMKSYDISPIYNLKDEYGIYKYAYHYIVYLWKINKFIRTFHNGNEYSSQIMIQSEDWNTKEKKKRFFITSNYVPFFYNNEPSLGILFGENVCKIDPINSDIIKLFNVAPQTYYGTAILNSDDSRCVVSGKNKINEPQFRLIDIKNSILFKNPRYSYGYKNVSHTNFLFNDLLLQTTNMYLYILDLQTQKIIDSILIPLGNYRSDNVTTSKFLKNTKLFITVHEKGTVNLWKLYDKSPIATINVGASIKNIHIIDNAKKLLVNTNDGYIYCYDIEELTTTDLNEQTEVAIDVKIHPNPASDFITINLSNKGLQPFAAVVDKLQIFDVLGIEVMSVETRNAVSLQPIDVSQLPSGVYFIRIGNRVEKFVKM